MEFLALPIFIFISYSAYEFSIKPHLAVLAILLVSVSNAWFIEPPSVNIGLNIYLHDMLFVPIFLSGVFRILCKQEWQYISPLWIFYGVIIFYGLYAGLKLYGTSSGVDFRNFFYYWAGALYFMSFGYVDALLDKIFKYWISICLILLAIVYFRFVAEFIHLPIAKTWISADSTGVAYRVVNSAQAYLLGTVVIILFHRYIIPSFDNPSRIMTALFLIAVITLQHRSVWAVTIFGIAATFLLPGIKKHKALSKLIVIGFSGMILLVPLVLSGYADNFMDSILGSAERATHLQTGTFGSRMKTWERITLYWDKLGLMDQLFGEPFGSGYAGSQTAPHNMFFHSLLRAGMLGTFILVWFYLGILLRLYCRLLIDKSNLVYISLFFMLVIAQIAYYIPYSPQPEHGVILGIAASLAKRKKVANQTRQPTIHKPHRLKPIPKSIDISQSAI